jgi:Dolichyl-phosphate-mannose-protein mannosyltransferase
MCLPSMKDRRGGVGPAALSAAAAILAVHAGLVVWASSTNFVVVDEVGHLAAGMTHLETGTFFAYRVNPPLPRLVAAVPMWLAGARVDYSQFQDGPGHRCEFPIGQDFAAVNGERYFTLARLARLTGVGWSLLGGLVVFVWARDLYGRPGGLLALSLWCFNPTVIGFAAVVVPDLPAAAAAVTAGYLCWRYLRRPSWAGAWFVGLGLGLAQLTKFTLLVLYPVWAVCFVIAWRAGRSANPPDRPRVRHAVFAVGVSVVVVNLGYEFSGTGRPLGEFAFVSEMFRGEAPPAPDGSGNRFRGTAAGRIPVLLPAEYVRGIDTQRKDFEAGLPSYLDGEWRNRGWWYYYLYGLGLKLPVGALALVAVGCLTTLRYLRRCPAADAAAVWLPAAAVVGFVSSQTGFNHHLRYVLPAVPLLFVGAGAAGRWVVSGVPFAGGAVVGLGLWAGVAGITVGPHFLSYFNPLGGGPERGHEHFVDSNIDWGQDLLHLKKWLDAHPDHAPLRLAYFNTIDPAVAGIRYQLPPSEPRPGKYAVSVHFVRGGSFPAFDGRGGTVWVQPGQYTYFQHFRPVGKAGYSIFLYEVSPEGANAARARMGLPPLPAGADPGTPAPAAVRRGGQHRSASRVASSRVGRSDRPWCMPQRRPSARR